MSEAPSPDTGVPVCYRHPGRESHIRCQRCERPICPDCMREASVGFQCPDCVAEGARTQRSPRTSYGGLIPANAGATSLVLIGINVVVWLVIQATGGAASRLVDLLALRPNGACASGGALYEVSAAQCASVSGLWLPGVVDGAFWQLGTTMFTQVGLTHLFFNVLNIYLLGPQLEAAFGRARYLALFLLSGLAGSAAVYWLSHEYSPTIGASGAVYGLLGAILVVVLRTRQPPQGMLLWIALGFGYSFLVPGISWQGHLGGFLGGLAVTGVLAFAPRANRVRFQWIGLGLIAAVIVALLVVRTLQLA